MAQALNLGQGKAASYMAGLNLKIVKAAGRRRQKVDKGFGDRLPASVAGAPVGLAVVRNQGARMTPLGHKTARRALSPILARLSADDPRLEVARLLADAVERVGAVKGVNWSGSDSSGGLSDGGVTTKIKHAARYRLIEALVNEWPVDGRHGPRVASAQKVLLTVKRPSEKRRNIRAFDAMVALCVEGASVDAILRAHGWSAQAYNRAPLRDALLDRLSIVAKGMGLSGGRW